MNPRLRKNLLAQLNAARGFKMPLSLLVQGGAGVWTKSEIEAEMRRLEADELTTTGRNALGEITYYLTAAGQAACAELGL